MEAVRRAGLAAVATGLRWARSNRRAAQPEIPPGRAVTAAAADTCAKKAMIWDGGQIVLVIDFGTARQHPTGGGAAMNGVAVLGQWRAMRQ